MGVFKRGKKWWIDFYDPNGNRVQLSSRSNRKPDAEALLAIKLSEIARGVYKPPSKITFEDFSTKYMDYAKGNKRSWLRDEQMLKPLTAFFGKERQLREMLPADIEGFKLYRRKEVSGSTVNRELALLKHMFNLAIAWDDYLGSNPVKKVRFFQEINRGNRVLSANEESRLLGVATPYIQDVVVFALNTGLRIGEILSLTWKSVDFENNLLTVFAQKTQKNREIPINAKARRVLEYWALGRKNEFIFYNHETGDRFRDLDTGLRLACEKAGIEGITWHRLRHTFTTRLLEQGVDVVTVQQLLGLHGRGNDALRAPKPRFQTHSHREARKFW